MKLITTTENLAILADENDLVNGTRHDYVLCKGSCYDSAMRFYSVPQMSQGRYTKLGQAKIDEYWSSIGKIADAWNEASEKAKSEHKSNSGASDLGGKLNDMLVKLLADQSAEAIYEQAMPMVRKKIMEEFGILPQTHEVKTPTGVHKINGILHEKFDTVLNLVYAGVPVFLTGAAGTGKNVICKQIAESLGLEFYFTNAVTQEYKLTGFIDANGEYHRTQFYKAFKNGGVFFLDEMDGSIPEVLIMLNAAIANGYFDFPNGKVEAHPDFRVIAAGNTYGTGADIEYTGRYQLDAASLDRFALVTIDYSPKIENAMAGGDEELCKFIRAFRKATANAGIRHLATYRSIDRIHKLSEAMDLSEVLRIALLKNLQKDDINVLLGEMNMAGNRYYDAMAKEV